MGYYGCCFYFDLRLIFINSVNFPYLNLHFLRLDIIIIATKCDNSYSRRMNYAREYFLSPILEAQ